MKTPVHRGHSQRGFTLAEILVALAIFAVIIAAALALYDQSNKVFKSGYERSEMQQNTRIAFDKMVAEVRMAGFDFDRDGIPSGSGGSAWRASTAYSVGTVVSPLVANGFTYVCSQAGTSGTNQPTWNTTIGGTTVDNTARWTTQAGINQYQQPDEQIEYAGAHALTLRANFDFESNASNGNGRETNLESPQFPIVTTGNDEIVTYALRADNGTNPDTLQFYADMPDRRAFPGGRAENLVRIPNVDLCVNGCNNPPYTLYRFHFTNPNDPSDPGNPAGGTLKAQAVATNVRSITFTYYNDTIGTATPMTFTDGINNVAGSSGGGQYNPNNPNNSVEARAERAKIKSIRVALVGMSASRDPKYVNPEEQTVTSTAAPVSPALNYRTYRLESLVVPRNLGKMGQKEQQEAPPGAPKLQSVCVGWCGVVRVSWQAAPETDQTGSVDQYIVIYDTVNPPVAFQKQVGPTTTAYVDGLDPTQRYYFTVAAVNSFGSTLAADRLPASGPGLQVLNRTTPTAPTNGSATNTDTPSTAQENQVTVRWDNPIDNVTGSSTVTCYAVAGGSTDSSPDDVNPGEWQAFQVMRAKNNPNFSPNNTADFTEVQGITGNLLTVGLNSSTFVDKSAVACEDYYYRVRVLERCYPATTSNNASPADPFSAALPPAGAAALHGRAIPSNDPAPPSTLIPPIPMPASPPAVAQGCGVTCAVYLSWPKVTQDASTPPKKMVVEHYVVTRKRYKNNAYDDQNPDPAAGPATVEFNVDDTTAVGGGAFVTTGASNDPWWLDNSGAPSVDSRGTPPLAYQYVYTVQAKLACTPERRSQPSSELRFPCPYTGGPVSVAVSGLDPNSGNGLAPGAAWQTDGSGSSAIAVSGTGMVSAQVLLQSLSSPDILDLGTSSTAPFNFPISGTAPGTLYRMYVVAKDASGCQTIAVRYLEEGTASGCCLAAFADDPFIMQFTPNSSFVDIFLQNDCQNDLQLQSTAIDISWTPAVSGTTLRSVEFPPESGVTRVATTVNNTSGTLSLSVPSGARNPVRPTDIYRIQLTFDRLLTTNPITGVCVHYQRPGIDTATQNCKIVPQPPATPNSCN